MDENKAAQAAAAARLRNAASLLRRKSMPLSDLIPLLQHAADLLDGAPPARTDWIAFDGSAKITGWRSVTGMHFPGELCPVMPGVALHPVREGPGCPVPAGTRVAVSFRDGNGLTTSNPEWMRWAWTRPHLSDADIVAYQVRPA